MSVFVDLTLSCCRNNLLDKSKASSVSVWLESWTATKAVIKVQTFQIIVLQGVVGSLPWTAMVFFTMWFELIGERKFKNIPKLVVSFGACCLQPLYFGAFYIIYSLDLPIKKIYLNYWGRHMKIK